MFLRLMELLFLVLVVLTIGTQIILPLWRNRPLFPIFSRRRVVESQLGEAAERHDLSALQQKMRDLTRKPKSTI